MDIIDRIIDRTIGKEGGYANHPADPGGETMWGITLRVARANGYTGPMSQLPRATAARIYRSEYFTKPGFERILAVSERIAEELFDTGVNMGVAAQIPQRFLQRSLNLCNRRGRDYGDIGIDGVIGGGTMAAIQSLFARRGRAYAEDLILKCLNGFQFARYVEISENGGPNDKDEEFFCGWITQRIGF